MERTRYEMSYKQGRGLLNPFPDRWSIFFWDYVKAKVNKKRKSLKIGDKKILVVGVGGGGALHGVLGDMVGIDINKELLKASQKIDPRKGFVGASASHLPFEKESFDIVVCDFVLHHLKGQLILEKSLKEFFRVLKKGGTLVAFEPNLLHPSGLLLNAVNLFGLYNKLLGGSNFEFSILPREISKMISSDFSAVKFEPLTYTYARLPVNINKLIISKEDWLGKSLLKNFCWAFCLEATK